MWSIFWRLEQSRQTPFESPQPVPPADLKAWLDLVGERLVSWELDALAAMDAARRKAMQDASAESGVFEDGPDGKPRAARRVVSFRNISDAEALFDRMGRVVEG